MSLPERINVIKTCTYYVPDVVDSLTEMGETDIDIDKVMEYIESWVYEDMGDLHNVIFQDENGMEL